MSFERVLAEAKARYVVGLTATPQRRDGHHPIIESQVGPVRFAVDSKSQAAQRPFAHTLIARETGFGLRGAEMPSIQELYGLLAAGEKRNSPHGTGERAGKLSHAARIELARRSLRARARAQPQDAQRAKRSEFWGEAAKPPQIAPWGLLFADPRRLLATREKLLRSARGQGTKPLHFT